MQFPTAGGRTMPATGRNKRRERKPALTTNKHAPKWDNRFYLKAYFLAKSGLPDKRIAEALGVDRMALKYWREKDPAFEEALAEGRTKHKRTYKGKAAHAEGEKFFEYVYKRLPPELKELWEELQRVDTGKNAEAKIEALLDGEGELTRMHLWVHALVMSNFSESEACRKVMISHAKLETWKADKDFQNLIDHLLRMKKDFCDESLMSLVAAKDPTIVWNVNRTLNADRGYDPAKKLQISGSVAHSHLHAAFPLEEFLSALPLEAKRQWLEWVRAAEAKAIPPKDVTHLVEVLPGEE